MIMRTIVAAFLIVSCGVASAQTPFPVVGTTYQIDRGRFPGKIAICATEKAMVSYLLAQGSGDRAALDKMTAEVDTTADFTRLKAREGCTPISSFSQATVVLKGKGVHRADFAAFPFGPMWGSPLYFGAPVK